MCARGKSLASQLLVTSQARTKRNDKKEDAKGNERKILNEKTFFFLKMMFCYTFNCPATYKKICVASKIIEEEEEEVSNKEE